MRFQNSIAALATVSLLASACAEPTAEPPGPAPQPVLWTRSDGSGAPIARAGDVIVFQRNTGVRGPQQSITPGAVLTAVDARAGVERWIFQNDSIRAVFGVGDAVFALLENRSILTPWPWIVLDAGTGTPRWRSATCQTIAPARLGALVLTLEGTDIAPLHVDLVGRDAATGVERWRRDVSRTGITCAYTSPLTTRGDTAILAVQGSATAPYTGRLRFARVHASGEITIVDGPPGLRSSLAMSGFRPELRIVGSLPIAVVRDTLRYTAVDVGTGAVIWTANLLSTPVSAPFSLDIPIESFLADNAGIYVSARDTLYRPVLRVLLDPLSGSVLRRDPPVSPTRPVQILGGCGGALFATYDERLRPIIVDWSTNQRVRRFDLSLNATKRPLYIYDNLAEVFFTSLEASDVQLIADVLLGGPISWHALACN